MNDVTELSGSKTPIETSIGTPPDMISSPHLPTSSSYGKDFEASRPENGKTVKSNGIVPDLQMHMTSTEEQNQMDDIVPVQRLVVQENDVQAQASSATRNILLSAIRDQLLNLLLNPEKFSSLSVCKIKSPRGYNEGSMKHMDPPDKGDLPK
ncbi:hypothetical protein HAX54_046559 [Datura stramonium]|uniref:Uncharacterized protein n=1 Tax=Datura stramonium TaxID=4076 RepID=A0ABS8WJ95_DATST|nr:hypothetical protein [Datura stramonium]